MRVAAVQLNSTADTAANLAAADRLTRAAAADGAKLIVLPEKWSVIGSESDLRAGAEELGEAAGGSRGSPDGPAISWARAIALELEVDLVAGSIAERVPTDRRSASEKLANTSVHVDPLGEVKAVYRKVHMFDVEIDGRSYRESAVEQPGEEIVLSETADGVELGLSICYDLRFPELFRILAVRGARVIALPAAFTLPTTRDHWETLVKARAIENQAFVIAANQVGPHPGGMRSGGRSMIVDSWGVVLAQVPDRPGYVVAELDLVRQLEIRAQLPALANRRPAAYRWPEETSA
jgi:predicted amidohydrolase